MIKVILFSFLAVVGYAVLFNINRHEIIYAGLCGALGYWIFWLTKDVIGSPIYATFLGGIFVGSLGEVFAGFRKKPATIYIVPGIIPLVPGYGLFDAILKFNLEAYDEAIVLGTEAILVAVALASSIIVSTTLGRLYREKSSERYNRYYH